MRIRLRIIRRSLLFALIILTIMLAPAVVRAIAPNTPFLSQIPSAEELFSGDDATAEGEEPDAPIVFGAVLPRPAIVETAINSPTFIPRQTVVQIDPTNYDARMVTDINGNLVNNQMIVVLHETVGSATSAINTFLNTHTNDNDQVSYHSLITRDGTIVYLVPPEMRAFGAGNSVFEGANGPETVRLDPVLPPSVNNFAYHASLESPSDGRGNGASHSGYTDAQYRSLAWLIAQTTIPDDRITTHRAVDRSGNRRDPRSFDVERFLSLVHSFQEER